MVNISTEHSFFMTILILCIVNSRGEDVQAPSRKKPIIYPKEKALPHLKNATYYFLCADRLCTSCRSSPCLPNRADLCNLREYEKTAICHDIQRLRCGIECGKIRTLYPENYYIDRKEVTRCRPKFILDNQRTKDMLLCPGIRCYEPPVNGFKSEERKADTTFFWAANGDVKNSILMFTEINDDKVELLGYVSDIELIRD